MNIPAPRLFVALVTMEVRSAGWRATKRRPVRTDRPKGSRSWRESLGSSRRREAESRADAAAVTAVTT